MSVLNPAVPSLLLPLHHLLRFPFCPPCAAYFTPSLALYFLMLLSSLKVLSSPASLTPFFPCYILSSCYPPTPFLSFFSPHAVLPFLPLPPSLSLTLAPLSSLILSHTLLSFLSLPHLSSLLPPSAPPSLPDRKSVV